MNNPIKLKPAMYENVELLESHWSKQFSETMELYLSISDDSLLFPFRKRAGLDTPGQPLTGWYGNSATTFGQKLAAFAKAYKATGDGRLKEKALYLAEEWSTCMDANPDALKYDTYSYDKLMGGLLEIYEHLGCEKALEYIEKLTDKAIASFKQDVADNGIQDEHLWKNSMIEWYTLPENILRAYQITGKEKYKEFAAVWDYKYMWDHALSDDFGIGARHAYSHINALSSAARLYWTSGDQKYLQAMIKIYDEVTQNQTYATGGYGPAEALYVNKESYLGDALKPTWDSDLEEPSYISFDGGSSRVRDDRWGSCEVSCCAWAVFKACNYLMMLTGEARFGGWVEQMLYNGTGGQIPITSDGKVMYYANYWLDGAFKTTEDRRLGADGSNFHWQCCTGTFPQDVAEYFNLLYYFDDRGVFVSQYLPSQTTFKAGGSIVTLKNCSKYPEESRIKFIVSTPKDVSFAFRFRVPSWVGADSSVIVNGQRLQMELTPDSWGVIEREWADGDVISIDFPFHLRFEPVDTSSPEIMALLYGPIVLAADESTIFTGDPKNPEQWIHAAEGKPFEFETEPGYVSGYDFLTRRFVPYYKIGEMEWYYMYNRVKKSSRKADGNGLDINALLDT